MARIDTSVLNSLIKPQRRQHIRTGNIVEKIAATAKFNMELINQLNNEQKSRVQVEGLKYIAKYFEAYVDNLARMNHAAFHHIYEPGATGDSKYRLFQSSIDSTKKPVLSYNFLPSKVAGASGYVFTNKAYVMENQIPLNIKATNAEYLSFEYEGNFYRKKEVFVLNPGGVEVENSFAETFNIFMATMANKALKEFGFFDRIEKGIASESRVVLARISAGKIEGMAAEAAKSANNIVKRLK